MKICWAGPQLVLTFDNRFIRHQACYSLLPARPGYMSWKAKRLGVLVSVRQDGSSLYLNIVSGFCPISKCKSTWKNLALLGNSEERKIIVNLIFMTQKEPTLLLNTIANINLQQWTLSHGENKHQNKNNIQIVSCTDILYRHQIVAYF